MAAAHTHSKSVMVVICSMMWTVQEGPHSPCTVAKVSMVTGKEAVGRWATQERPGPILKLQPGAPLAGVVQQRLPGVGTTVLFLGCSTYPQVACHLGMGY